MSTTAPAHPSSAALRGPRTVDPTGVDLEAIRRHFPGLDGGVVLLENAGGSQVPEGVADAVRHHMLHDYVQLGAGYATSTRATKKVADAHAFIETFMHAGTTGRVILGSSCTQLVVNLADAHARSFADDDEIIVFDGGHEANVGPWMNLRNRGVTVHRWACDPDTGRVDLDALDDLLSDRTRLVAMVQVSNLLGAIENVRAVADRVHAAGARLFVDGVAYAPHRAIDVQALGADWYVYSTYKVYGPHMAAVFGTHEALAAIDGPNHFFIPRDDVPYVFELGGASHEGCAGLLGLRPYLCELAAMDGSGEPVPDPEAIDFPTVQRAFDVMTACEVPLQTRLVEWLGAHPRYQLVGPATGDPAARISTIAFRHASRSSKDVADALIARGFGVRNGHMYSLRMCEAMGVPVNDGVVRISAVHYNTPDEIESIIAALEAVDA